MWDDIIIPKPRGHRELAVQFIDVTGNNNGDSLASGIIELPVFVRPITDSPSFREIFRTCAKLKMCLIGIGH
jgi:hypothetical protein